VEQGVDEEELKTKRRNEVLVGRGTRSKEGEKTCNMTMRRRNQGGGVGGKD
jgi:hypothetical protein